MRQRLGIAGALLRDPRLLLLDEPATGLDPAGMRDMRLLVRRLADEGMTVLLSSHLMAEVEELCDRVAIVRSGRVRLRGLAARADRHDRRPLRAAHDRRRARARGRAPASRASTRSTAIEAAASRSRRRGRGARGCRSRSAQAGIGIRALVPRTATLEELFFRHHRGRGVAATGRAAGARRGSRHERRHGSRTAPHRAARRRPGVGTVYGWELRKLRAQKRTYLGLGAAAVGAADLHRRAARQRSAAAAPTTSRSGATCARPAWRSRSSGSSSARSGCSR